MKCSDVRSVQNPTETVFCFNFCFVETVFVSKLALLYKSPLAYSPTQFMTIKPIVFFYCLKAV